MTGASRWASSHPSHPGPPWAAVEFVDSLSSTNAVLREDPAPWRVLAADEQTAGRGRLGRSWATVPGASLAFSVVIPDLADRMPWLPLAAGVALARAIEGETGLETTLKWPNDVLLPGDEERKVAGILGETVGAAALLGIGLNVDATREQLPVDSATSLALAGAAGVDREALLTRILTELAGVVGDLERRGSALRAEYRRRCASIGRRVRIEGAAGGDLTGEATGVDDSARLMVRGPTGVTCVSVGDVVHAKGERW